MSMVSRLLRELLEFLQLLKGQHGAQPIDEVALQRLHLLAPVLGRQLRAGLENPLALRALAGEDINSRHPGWQWKWVASGPVKFGFDSRLAELMERSQKPQ